MIEAYIISILILVCIYIILAVSLNLALGYTGLLNMGHVAFFGIGAYTVAILTKAGVPFIIAFIATGIIASFAGYILVYATKNLKGDYLALATLGFSFVIYSLMLNWTGLTRGALGIAGIAKPCILGICAVNNNQFLIYSLIITIITILIIYRIINSPFGRLLGAVRDDELGLRILGKDTFKIKAKAMMISAFFAGIAGCIFAQYISYIDPSSFIITELILIFTIVIVGGLASTKGSIIAAFIIIIIPELLRLLSIPDVIIGPARQILYALVLITILLIRPRGIFGRVDLQ